MYFHLLPEADEEKILTFMKQKGFSCGVMLSYFVLRVFAERGQYDMVYELLVNEGEHGWVNMLREGATTCFEAWGKDQKWNTSLCHPWASAPIPILIEEIAGVHIDAAEKGGYYWTPHIPKEIREFRLCVPVKGKKSLSKRKWGKHMQLSEKTKNKLKGVMPVTKEEREDALASACMQVKRVLPEFTTKFQNAYSENGFYRPIDNVEWRRDSGRGRSGLPMNMAGRTFC